MTESAKASSKASSSSASPSITSATPAIPSFDIVDPTGRRRRVHPHSESDTVADLAGALGCVDGNGITIDGHAVGAGRTLTSITELVDGARLDSAPAAEAPAEFDVEFAIVAGPSCSTWSPLPAGRHGVGRSPHATIRLADPLAEIHHAVLDVAPDGMITLTQLTGRVPILVVRPHGDVPGASSSQPAGRFEQVALGDSLLVGSSRIDVRRRVMRAPGDDSRRGTIAPIAGDPWRREVRRGPSRQTEAPDARLALPSPELRPDMPAATALVGAVLAVIGAVVIAGLLGQMMFAVFAAVGAIASGATWAVGAVSVWRRRRAARRDAHCDRARFLSQVHERHLANRERHQRRHQEIVEVLDMLTSDRAAVWHERAIEDGLDVVVGRGTCRADIPVESTSGGGIEAGELAAVIEQATLLRDVAVPIRLAPREAAAVRGEPERVRGLIRSMLVQLAATVGPADLRLVVVGDPERWDWVTWLPHVRSQARSSLIAPSDLDRLGELTVATGADATRAEGADSTLAGVGMATTATTLLVIDDPALLAVRTGPLRRFMSATGATTIVAIEVGAPAPAVCRRTLDVTSSGGAEWTGDTAEWATFTDVVIAGLDQATACRAARSMTPLVDPEAADGSDGRLPDETTLTALDPVVTSAGAEAIARRWAAAGVDPSLRAPVGTSADGTVEVDLVADGPHALVAGTTGSGKSEFLRTLVVSMAGRVSPVHLNFVLIDYKGGSTFDSCADLPHTVGLVTDLDDGLAHRALVSLEAELARRERLLRGRRVADLTEYRRCEGVEPIPRLVVVIDEFATLAHDLPDFLRALVAIAQRGRSLGVHIVLATQRPAGVVTDDIRANTDLRLALRVSDVSEARDVVDDARPAMFSKSLPGRAMLRLASDEPIVFQAARCTGGVPERVGGLWVEDAPGSGDRPVAGDRVAATTSELGAAVRSICQAVDILGLAPPRRPWIDPLPARLDHEAVDVVAEASDGPVDHDDPDLAAAASPTSNCHDAIGLLDDPTNQRRLPLRWDHAAGNLAIIGSLGSGRTSTVVALMAALCRVAAPAERHVYVIDGTGDRSLDGLATVAHCGAVVRVGETERIDRLLRRLTDEVDRRSTIVDSGSPFVQIILFVDGLVELRRSLDAVERLDALAELDRILDAGPSVGVTSCVTLDGGVAASTTSSAERWVLRLDDPDLGRAMGLRTTPSGREPPGRLRVVSTGLEGQVAVGADGLACLPSRPHVDGPSDLLVLPSNLDPSVLPQSHTSADSGRPVRHLVVGLESDGLVPAALRVPDGDHVLVGGAARTGVSTALGRLASAWVESSHGTSVPVVVRWRGSVQEVRAGLDEMVGVATLLVVDDAERTHDRDGLFAEILRGDHPHVTIAAGARLEAVRSAYGHWTREVARSRCGIVMTAPGEVDGELLGALLPRRTVIGHRPGLGWVIDGGGHRLVQLAGRMPE